MVLPLVVVKVECFVGSEGDSMGRGELYFFFLLLELQWLKINCLNPSDPANGRVDRYDKNN